VPEIVRGSMRSSHLQALGPDDAATTSPSVLPLRPATVAFAEPAPAPVALDRRCPANHFSFQGSIMDEPDASI